MSPKTLIVDDEPEIRDYYARVLEKCGHTVVSASSAEEALGILSSERFDLLLSDIQMPGGMSGIQLACEAQKNCPHTKVILSSGGVTRSQVPRGVGFIAKPSTINVIVEEVARVLQ